MRPNHHHTIYPSPHIHIFPQAITFKIFQLQLLKKCNNHNEQEILEVRSVVSGKLLRGSVCGVPPTDPWAVGVHQYLLFKGEISYNILGRGRSHDHRRWPGQRRRPPQFLSMVNNTLIRSILFLPFPANSQP